MSEVEQEEQPEEGFSLPIEMSNYSTATSTSPAPKLQNLQTDDAREADDEIAWTAYKRIEPRYSRTNKMLANM